MIDLRLIGAGKSYMGNWIFRDLSLVWQQGKAYAITGPNGSGKSTLVGVLMGITLPTKGTVEYRQEEQPLDPEKWHQHLTLAAPYQELIEEFTLLELLRFHFQFKQPYQGWSVEQIIERMYLGDARHKPVRYFSSGMKQRLRLGLAFFSQSEVVFLDEPTSNLDERAKDWYQQQLTEILPGRLVVIASNEPKEYEMCDEVLDLSTKNN